MLYHGARKLTGSSFLFLDEKKRTKPACQAQATATAGREKSKQNNASTRMAIAPPAVLLGQHALRITQFKLT